MKPAASVFVTVPRELLPDVLEIVTNAYTRMQATLQKDERTISDLQFDIAELRNKAKIAEAKEAEPGDDF